MNTVSKRDESRRTYSESLFVRCQADWLLRSALQPRYPSPCLKPGACRAFGQLRIGAEATDNSDRLIYSNCTGNLFFDVDGIGGAGQIHLAKPSRGLPITYLDIVVN